MLWQKCSYGKDIETLSQKTKSKEKIELSLESKKKKVKANFPAENDDIWWCQ